MKTFSEKEKTLFFPSFRIVYSSLLAHTVILLNFPRSPSGVCLHTDDQRLFCRAEGLFLFPLPPRSSESIHAHIIGKDASWRIATLLYSCQGCAFFFFFNRLLSHLGSTSRAGKKLLMKLPGAFLDSL